jgi:hypothetical protein
MRQTQLSSFIMVVMAFACLHDAHAGRPIALDDFTASATVIDFENLSTMGTHPGISYPQVTIQNFGQNPGFWGVRQSNGLLFSHIPGASMGVVIGDQTALTDVVFQFTPAAQPIHRVGFLIYGATNGGDGPTQFDVTVSGGINTELFLFEEPDTGDNRGMFVGIQEPWSIERVRVQERQGLNSAHQRSTTFDDLRFEAIPEPATITIAWVTVATCFGVWAVGAGRRK